MRLTKSRFTSALSCPTKLYYAYDDRYADQAADDSFLDALTEGGFQVGELAKYQFAEGHQIDTLNETDAIHETNRLLQKENVVIFEAALKFENCLVRIDILKKSGNKIDLFEVKAKSYDSSDPSPFLSRSGEPKSQWKKYLYDVAFQKWVVKQALPECHVAANLMLVDKYKRATVSGLNQRFRIAVDENGRKGILADQELSLDNLGDSILITIDLDPICARILESREHGLLVDESFAEMIGRLSSACETGGMIDHPVSKACGECQYNLPPSKPKGDKLDGRAECFVRKLGCAPDVFNEPTIFDLWNYSRKDDLLRAGIIKLRDVSDNWITLKKAKVGLSTTERQLIQIEKERNNDNSFYIDRKGLASEIGTWKFPLHFIDFETTMVAVPFLAGQHPYEGIAFQFSHHTVEADGTVRHAGQYLNTSRGEFPNYDFTRELRNQLSNDDGTIFCYSPHENTFLNLIVMQLERDANPPDDTQALVGFIKEITHSKKDAIQPWIGKRDMIDLLDVVKKYYYDPLTQGSNSIKYVLPAVLQRSDYLKKYYANNNYGSENGTPSLNFHNWCWIQYDTEGKVIDPYSLLPEVFSEEEKTHIDLLSASGTLNNGGAALIAYARMQFDEMSDMERSRLSDSLLKYCELDTLAMVMIYQFWKEVLDI